MKPVQRADPLSAQAARSQAAQRIARAKATLAMREIKRGRFTRRDIEYDIRRGEFAIGFWFMERDLWRLYKLVVSNALYFEFQIDKEVPFARLSRTVFNETKLIFNFEKVIRITVGISELKLSCHRTEAVRSDWPVKRWIFPFKWSPRVPTM
jgi:hypothetical protein